MEELHTDTLPEDTTPTAEESNETAETESPDAAPQAEGGNEEQSEQNGDGANEQETGKEGADYLPIVFDHEERALTREEAIKYAQLGLRHEKLDPLISKIDYLAAVSGMSREEYIENQYAAHEKNMRQEIISKFGDDEDIVNEMMEFNRQKNKKAYEDMLNRQKKADEDTKTATETRLAEEYAMLTKEFPELENKGFKDLPASVKQAGFRGEKLINAYLLYKHSENKKTVAAQDNAKKQEKASVGSMAADGSAETVTDAEKQFLNALWSK